VHLLDEEPEHLLGGLALGGLALVLGITLVAGAPPTGEPIALRAAIKPISTMKKPMRSVDLVTKEKVEAHYERSDICIVPAAGVIGEAMVALVLAEAFLEKFGGDSIGEIERNHRSYLEQVGLRIRD